MRRGSRRQQVFHRAMHCCNRAEEGKSARGKRAVPLPRQGCRESREGGAAPHRPWAPPDSACLLSRVSLSEEDLSLDALFCPFSHLTSLCRVCF